LLHQEFSFQASYTSRCYREGAVTEELISKRLCNHHAWEMGKIAAHETFALILVEFLRTEGVADPVPQPGMETSYPKANESGLSCLVCDYLEMQESTWVGRFIERLADHNFLSNYLRSSGLCLVHLRRILPRVESLDIKHSMTRHAIERIMELAEKLEQMQLAGEFRGLGRNDVTLASAAQKLFGRRGLVSGALYERTAENLSTK
jgi:hypothetical protein